MKWPFGEKQRLEMNHLLKIALLLIATFIWMYIRIRAHKEGHLFLDTTSWDGDNPTVLPVLVLLLALAFWLVPEWADDEGGRDWGAGLPCVTVSATYLNE